MRRSCSQNNGKDIRNGVIVCFAGGCSVCWPAHLLENCVSVTTVTFVLSLVIFTLSPRMPAVRQ